jgi:2-keto-3-deoxy-L-fuconate dehydrogenase
MLSTRLDGKRILLTPAREFMGPALQEVFTRLGAQVIADERALDQDPALPAALVREAGQVDVLVVHLALPAPVTPAAEIDDAEWRRVFAHLGAWAADDATRRRAHPGDGQCRRAARAETHRQLQAYVQAVGLELAPLGIQLNAIAQNFVDNPTYFGPEVQANPRFQERLKREVPLGRLVHAEEDALLAGYLCSDAAACFVGQVFPLSGGWAIR